MNLGLGSIENPGRAVGGSPGFTVGVLGSPCMNLRKCMDPRKVGARGGGDYPAQALWNGIREGEGKGLRRTGVRRTAAAAPGPGRGGRVPPKAAMRG